MNWINRQGAFIAHIWGLYRHSVSDDLLPLDLISFWGVYFSVKGRVGKMVRVGTRFTQRGPRALSKHNSTNPHEVDSNSDSFTTRWGATNCFIQLAYPKRQHIYSEFL